MKKWIVTLLILSAGVNAWAKAPAARDYFQPMVPGSVNSYEIKSEFLAPDHSEKQTLSYYFNKVHPGQNQKAYFYNEIDDQNYSGYVTEEDLKHHYVSLFSNINLSDMFNGYELYFTNDSIELKAIDEGNREGFNSSVNKLKFHDFYLLKMPQKNHPVEWKENAHGFAVDYYYRAKSYYGKYKNRSGGYLDCVIVEEECYLKDARITRLMDSLNVGHAKNIGPAKDVKDNHWIEKIKNYYTKNIGLVKSERYYYGEKNPYTVIGLADYETEASNKAMKEATEKNLREYYSRLPPFKPPMRTPWFSMLDVYRCCGALFVLLAVGLLVAGLITVEGPTRGKAYYPLKAALSAAAAYGYFAGPVYLGSIITLGKSFSDLGKTLFFWDYLVLSFLMFFLPDLWFPPKESSSAVWPERPEDENLGDNRQKGRLDEKIKGNELNLEIMRRLEAMSTPRKVWFDPKLLFGIAATAGIIALVLAAFIEHDNFQIFMLAWSTVFLLIFFGPLMFSLPDLLTGYHYLKNGLPVMGRIVDRKRGRIGRGDWYVIDYSFRGQTIRKVLNSNTGSFDFPLLLVDPVNPKRVKFYLNCVFWKLAGLGKQKETGEGNGLNFLSQKADGENKRRNLIPLLVLLAALIAVYFYLNIHK